LKPKTILSFPNHYGRFYGHRAMIKLKCAPLLVESQKQWTLERRNEPLEALRGMRCGISRFLVGSMQACRPRRSRRSQGTQACK
jgi:hypothetical protein